MFPLSFFILAYDTTWTPNGKFINYAHESFAFYWSCAIWRVSTDSKVKMSFLFIFNFLSKKFHDITYFIALSVCAPEWDSSNYSVLFITLSQKIYDSIYSCVVYGNDPEESTLKVIVVSFVWRQNLKCFLMLTSGETFFPFATWRSYSEISLFNRSLCNRTKNLFFLEKLDFNLCFLWEFPKEI